MTLRVVTDDDLDVLFAHQLDPDANYRAAFIARDPCDRAAFDAHWLKIRSDRAVIIRTIELDGQVAGHVASFLYEGHREVTYWLGKQYWGHGLATRALAEFLLAVDTSRPLRGLVARDNDASRRVLEKCGFTICGAGRGFSRARGEQVDELILELV